MTDITGYEGKYAVTEDGQVWSHQRAGTGGHLTGRWLVQNVRRNGYHQVGLLDASGKRTWYGVHRLVALMFITGYAKGLVVNHLDGNKANNHASNLEWCTQQRNRQHWMETHSILGENNPNYRHGLRVRHA